MPQQRNSRVPSEGESDENNVRLRSFQGGTDSLSSPPTRDQTYGQMRYADGEGPHADMPLPNSKGAGLSGLPQADAGNTPALFNDPDAADPTTPQRGSGA